MPRNAKELANELIKEDTPLEEFKEFEKAKVGHFSDKFPLRKNTIPYKSMFGPYEDYLDEYARSNAPYSDKAYTDAALQDYFAQQVKRKNALKERLGKIPKDKWENFTRGYGSFQDPFDWEDEYFTPFPQEDAEKEMLYNPTNWEIVEEYLDKEGY